MWDLLTEHSGLVQATMAAVTALIWLVYLHVIVAGLRRQRRTEILIHLGGARDLNARIMVSNLGFEPIYVLEIILKVWSATGERISSVADRTEMGREGLDKLEVPSQATLQGPLKSGDFVDIGNVTNLLDRARNSSFEVLDSADVQRIEITVAAVTAANTSIAAASRRFRMESREGRPVLIPEGLYARQIRGRFRRRQIERRLDALM